MGETNTAGRRGLTTARTARAAGATGMALALLLVVPTEAWADHIPSAQEGLGGLWWGVGFLGLVGMTFIGSIAYTVVKLSRREDAREESRDPS